MHSILTPWLHTYVINTRGLFFQIWPRRLLRGREAIWSGNSNVSGRKMIEKRLVFDGFFSIFEAIWSGNSNVSGQKTIEKPLGFPWFSPRNPGPGGPETLLFPLQIAVPGPGNVAISTPNRLGSLELRRVEPCIVSSNDTPGSGKTPKKLVF